MIRNNIRTILFAAVMALFLAVPLYMIWRYEYIHSAGNVFRFRSEPVDPYDAFRGKYLTLFFNDLQSIPFPNAQDKFATGQMVHLAIKSTDSVAVVTNVFTEPPPGSDYITMEVRYVYEDKIFLNVPFDRFYVNEELAPMAEAAYREYSAESDVFVDLRVLNGKALIDEVYIKNKPLIKFLKEDFQKDNLPR